MTRTYNTAIGTILVEQRENVTVTGNVKVDYIAEIADRKTQWGSGITPQEAIGDLLISHFSE